MKIFGDIDADGVKTLHYRCPDCRYANTCAALPHSPVVAKHKCRQCGRVNEVQTRETFEEFLGEHVAEGKDRNRVAKRTSVNIHRAGGIVDRQLKKAQKQLDERRIAEASITQHERSRPEILGPDGERAN